MCCTKNVPKALSVYLLSSGLYRRFRNFTESAQILCARGLYHRWRISLRPETDYFYIICLFLCFVKGLFETCFAVLVFGNKEALKICRLIDKRHKTYSCVSYLDCLFDIVQILSRCICAFCSGGRDFKSLSITASSMQ